MANSDKLLQQIKNYRPVSEENQLRDFVHSTLHQDFENEIMARIEDMRDYNEICSSKEYLSTRGGILALRMSLNIFRDLAENKHEDVRSKFEMKEEDSNA